MSGGVALYAAQTNVQADAKIAENSDYRIEMRRGDREADGARLLSECSVCYPGFESPPLRQLNKDNRLKLGRFFCAFFRQKHTLLK